MALDAEKIIQSLETNKCETPCFDFKGNRIIAGDRLYSEQAKNFKITVVRIENGRVHLKYGWDDKKNEFVFEKSEPDKEIVLVVERFKNSAWQLVEPKPEYKAKRDLNIKFMDGEFRYAPKGDKTKFDDIFEQITGEKPKP
jgi:hypothetical protein